MNISKKNIFITGAAGWIGSSITEILAASAAKLYLLGRDFMKLENLAKSLGTDIPVLPITCDLACENAVSSVCNEVKSKIDYLDVLILNAAIYPADKIENLKYSDWCNVLNTNLNSNFLITKKFLPLLKKSDAGRIIFISSVAGETLGVPRLSHYAASKAALNGFMRTISIEFAAYNITVNSISPGNICNAEGLKISKTRIIEMQKVIPLGKIGKPQDIAHIVNFLASDYSGFITGQNIIVDGGQSILADPGHLN